MPHATPPRAGLSETEHPTEWLRHLDEDRGRYRRLLEESGLALAAYRIARARCRVAEFPTEVPTLRELRVAVGMLVDREKTPAPNPWLLAEECEQSGMPVITPLPPAVHAGAVQSGAVHPGAVH